MKNLFDNALIFHKIGAAYKWNKSRPWWKRPPAPAPVCNLQTPGMGIRVAVVDGGSGCSDTPGTDTTHNDGGYNPRGIMFLYLDDLLSQVFFINTLAFFQRPVVFLKIMHPANDNLCVYQISLRTAQRPF